MRDHYIVCGYGEIGSAICGALKEKQLPFVVITQDESSKAAIARMGYAIVSGNPTQDTSLKEAGIERAVGVIAILTDDADNLFISLAARELNPKILIIARGEDTGVEDRILRAGADIVVSPMKLGGQQIAQLIEQEAGELPATDQVPLATDVMGLHLTSYRHTRDEPTTAAAVLLSNEAFSIAGIRRDNGEFKPCQSDTEVNENDVVILIKQVGQQVGEQGDSFHKPPTGKTILLADDHRALRLLFSRKLASAGHDVIQAATGDEAERLANAQHPDLIVLDVNMPGRDGYDVCRSIRQSQQLAKVPVILYSGQDNYEFVSRGHQAGADLCVRKTSKSSELLERIEEVFANNLAHEEPVGEEPNAGLLTPSLNLQEALENTNGDQRLLSELMAVLQEETPKIMKAIQQAIDAKDNKSIQRSAHELKGSLVIVSAEAATAAATELELAAQAGDAEAILSRHQELKSSVLLLMAELNRFAVSPS